MNAGHLRSGGVHAAMAVKYREYGGLEAAATGAIVSLRKGNIFSERKGNNRFKEITLADTTPL